MKHSKWLSMGLSIFVLLMVMACAATSEDQYSNPPLTFQESQLVGTWEAHYTGWGGEEWGSDRLVLRADGTFKQAYRDYTVADYIYETPWNEWWVERFSDGRVRVHLQGARVYKAGIELAELEGMWADSCPEDLPDCGWDQRPWAFYDPIGDESVYMVGELVLNARIDSTGNTVLLHMLLSRDDARLFPSGESTSSFSRIEAESQSSNAFHGILRPETPPLAAGRKAGFPQARTAVP